ncbi:MAG: RIP metalloprotease RseP [Mangrovibacterium sp.]
MQEILIKAAQLVLSLSLLVIIHEFGHFLFARLFKTRVEKFYLFFNPWFSLWKKKIGETEYGIGWVPLGGYVAISGMVDESMNTEALKEEPKPWEFRSKNKWQRLLIMIGGVLFNFILAFIIYIGILFTWGTSYLPTTSLTEGISVNAAAQAMGFENGDKIISVDGREITNFAKFLPTIAIDGAKQVEVQRNGSMVEVPITTEFLPSLLKGEMSFEPRLFSKFNIAVLSEDGPAQQAGLQAGDKVASIDSHSFQFYDQMTSYIRSHANRSVTFQIIRGENTLNIPVTVSESGTVGFQPQFAAEAYNYLEYKTIDYGFFEAIPAGFKLGFTTIKSYLNQLKLFFKPETKAYESLGGFIAIGNIFPSSWDWYKFWNMTAFLSIILGVMNLLPIPALDGGHVMFLLWEIITGRKPSDKFLEYAQTVGMILLLILVVYANGNDILRLFK